MKTLEMLCANGYLSFIDLSLARELLRQHCSENAASLICHLSLSARRGHLCIEINHETVFPDPVFTWSENRIVEEGCLEETNSKILLENVSKMIIQGANELPAHLLTKILPDHDPDFKVQTPISTCGNRFYFQRYWFYESIFVQCFQNFVLRSPSISLDHEKMRSRVQQLIEKKELLPEQGDAILNACHNTLTVICGGPGTGKTYTAGKLICLLWETLSSTKQEKFEIALAAPTGKAAANLQKSLNKAAKNIEKLSSLHSKTLHALLHINSSGAITELNELPYDLVIVDESSMIDVRLMAALFTAMKPGSRLILLGDHHQLPAVEAGSIFGDLVQLEIYSGMSVSRLEKCLRVELQGILDVASKINEGDAEGALQLFENQKYSGVERLNFDSVNISDSAIAKKICHYAHKAYQMEKLNHLNHAEILNHFNQFRLLSPLRKGLFGVEEINRLISQEYSAKFQSKQNYIAPIMLLKNDYRLELFNGEVGALIRPAFNGFTGVQDFMPGDYAIFLGKDGQVKQVPALLLPAFEFAYCLSVHKSQGSEFEHLLFLLPPGSECFGRELLYTAVTRAKKQLTIWGEDTTLKAAINRRSTRFSGIPKRLYFSARDKAT